MPWRWWLRRALHRKHKYRFIIVANNSGFRCRGKGDVPTRKFLDTSRASPESQRMSSCRSCDSQVDGKRYQTKGYYDSCCTGECIGARYNSRRKYECRITSHCHRQGCGIETYPQRFSECQQPYSVSSQHDAKWEVLYARSISCRWGAWSVENAPSCRFNRRYNHDGYRLDDGGKS